MTEQQADEPIPLSTPLASVTDSIRRKLTLRSSEELEAVQREQERRAHSRACALNHAALLRQMGTRFHPDRVSLDSYEVTTDRQRWVLGQLRDLADRLPEAIRQGECLVLYGSPGTGKDHLMASLLHLAAGKHGFSAGWVAGARFYARFRDLMQARRGEAGEVALIDSFTSWTVLGISDPIPPATDPTGWAVNQLQAVVNARYEFLRPTWITANVKTVEELKDKLSVQLYERLADQGCVLPCFWPTHRAPRVAPGANRLSGAAP